MVSSDSTHTFPAASPEKALTNLADRPFGAEYVMKRPPVYRVTAPISVPIHRSPRVSSKSEVKRLL